MDQDAIIQYITDTFAGIEVLRPGDGPGAGDTFFFTASQRDVDPTRRQPFATMARSTPALVWLGCMPVAP
jgi:hypothetical protein